MRFPTGWISDLHLGSRGFNAEAMYHFLKVYDFDKLYVVGDFLDLWRMRRSRYWPQSHTDVLQKLLKKSRKGTQLIFIPGNHDEGLLHFLGEFGNIAIVKNDIHTTADGRRMMVMHGHEFDIVTMNHRWVAHLGEIGYNALLQVNTGVNRVRRVMRLPYWSLSAFIKHKVKDAVSHISNFENTLVKHARNHNVDGIICGHIHTPAVRQMDDGVWYYNSGDWVESCTALVEDDSGMIRLIHLQDFMMPRDIEAMQSGDARGIKLSA